MSEIIIRPLTEIWEFEQAVHVQKMAWNRSDYSLVPPTMLKSFTKNGGCVIGALILINDSEILVGYAFGFLAMTSEHKLYHHSQQVAVLPEFQNLGIAKKLKLAQIGYVKDVHGLKIMTWTVDPLLAKNAKLNYHKLGAIGRIYWENYYGSRDDSLNSGLETDRIEVECYFSDPELSMISKVRENIPGHINIYNYSNTGQYPEDIQLDEYLGILIPKDLVLLKTDDLDLANKIRISFRLVAQFLIKNNYAIIDIKDSMGFDAILIWSNKLKKLKRLKASYS